MRLGLLAVVALVGCSAPSQVVTGRIDPGFPSTITSVKVTTSSIQSWHGDAHVTTAPVAADGSFRLEIPPMKGVRIQLLAADGRTTVVFPRQSGVLASALSIRPNGADFDLGMIRYIGDASATHYAFKTSGGASEDCDDDGMDANGATCVDDSDEDQNTCGQDDNNEQEGDNEDDGDQPDGDNQDGEHADPDDGPDMGDAVAEHNFPADGCSDDQGDDDDENDDEGESD